MRRCIEEGLELEVEVEAIHLGMRRRGG